MRTKKLSIKALERMIKEEVAKYEADVEAKAKETDEVEADEYADTLEKPVDHTPDEPKVEALRRRDAKLYKEEKRARRAVLALSKRRKALKRKYKKLTR